MVASVTGCDLLGVAKVKTTGLAEGLLFIVTGVAVGVFIVVFLGFSELEVLTAVGEVT